MVDIKFGDVKELGTTEIFGLSKCNNTGDRLIEFCVKNLVTGNNYFKLLNTVYTVSQDIPGQTVKQNLELLMSNTWVNLEKENE